MEVLDERMRAKNFLQEVGHLCSDLLPRGLKVMLKSRSFLRAWQGKTAIARVASCRHSDDKSDTALKRFEMLDIPREVRH